MRVMFVCLGNICRSPMAEMIMKEMVKKEGISSEIFVSSSGISDEEEGNGMYPPAQKILIEKGIKVEERCAKKITQEDIFEYDYIVVMEKYQKDRILKNYIVSNPSKVECLNNKDVLDPWYTGDFLTTYEEIYQGCSQLLKKIKKEL